MSRLPHLRRIRRLPAVGASALLLVAGGSGLVAAAWSNGPAAADSPLGGFTINALAESISAQYEQPNFPIPATPSLEFDEGYAATSDNYGPNGTAVASTLYPGQVVANAGPQLALLVPGVPLPGAPVWPVEATSEYPQTPNSQSTDQPGVNMDATSTTTGNTASASLGNDAPTAGASGIGVSPTAPSGSGNPFASSSSFVGIGSMSATSSSLTPSTSPTANADASATVTGVSFLGGFINIGSVTSTADAISDGTTGKVTGSTVVQNMSIAGEPVTIDSQGIHAQGQSAPLAVPVSTLNTLLSELGISIAVNDAKDTVTGPSASRTLDGLTMTVDLKTLDDAANKFGSLLPASFTSQLPFALPNDQQLTLDLATVQVQSTASPNFVSGNTGNTGSGGAAPSAASTSPAVTGNTGAGSFTGNTGLGASVSSPGGGTGGVAPPQGSSAPQATGPVSPAVASAAFKGVGSAAILLGLLAAAAMAYLYKRADDATELLTANCADGDPVGERFAASAEDLNQFGG